MIRDEPYRAELRESETPYRGKVWDVVRERFAYGEGELVRDYIDHPGAVAILVLDELGRVLLIRQYRHPVGLREWEIPAGLLDVEGESALLTAQRELAEEVDLRAERWHVLADYASSPGSSSEAIRVYLARGVSPTGSVFERTGEEADLEQRWVALDEVVDAVLARRVQNPSLVVGALAAHVARARAWKDLAPADEPWPARPGTA